MWKVIDKFPVGAIPISAIVTSGVPERRKSLRSSSLKCNEMASPTPSVTNQREFSISLEDRQGPRVSVDRRDRDFWGGL